MNIPSIYRFSGDNLIQPESVADHVAECVGLVSILYSKFGGFDYIKTIAYVSVHDLGECFTGDIVRPVKYSTPEMKSAFDLLEYKLLATNLCKEIADLATECKHQATIESAVTFFIDVFQAAYKLYREYNIQQSESFLGKLEYSVNVLNENALPYLKKYTKNNKDLYNYCKELSDNLSKFMKKEKTKYE